MALDLGNLVFNDINANGTFDPGETGLAGITLTLFGDFNQTNDLDGDDSPIATATTDGNGNYLFAGLDAGDYIVRVDAENFDSGGVLFGYNSSIGGPDPDNDINSDDNGVAAAGAFASRAITLMDNLEPVTDGDVDSNTNLTLDFGFIGNAAPTLADVTATGAYTENAAAVVLDNNVTITDDAGTLASATISITSGLLGGDVLAANPGATGIVALWDADSGILSLSGTTTLAAYEGVLETVTYRSTSEDPTNNDTNTQRVITWRVFDGVAQSNTQQTTVTVTAVDDDAAVPFNDAVTTPENAYYAGSVFSDNGEGADFDPEGDPFAVIAVNGLPGRVGNAFVLASGAAVLVRADGSFIFDPNGRLNALPAGDSGASNLTVTDTLTYTVTGGSVATVTLRTTGVDSNDVLNGSGGDDTLAAGIGDDRLVYGAGFDFFGGGPGSDTADFSGFGAAVNVDFRDTPYEAWTRDGPTVESGTWRRIVDFDSIENVIGTAFNDALRGSDGANVLSYTGGYDQLDGAGGEDTADFSRFGSAVLVDFTATAYEVWTKDLPTLEGGTWRNIANLANIENAVGTAFNDDLFGDGAANVLGYTGGYDHLDGAGGSDTADFSAFGSAIEVDFRDTPYEAWTKDLPTLEGGTWRRIADFDSIENVVGTAYNDALSADDGNNVLFYTGGYDHMNGAGGSDTADFSRFGSAVQVDLRDTPYEAWTKDLPTLAGGTWRQAANLFNVENVTGTLYGDWVGGDAGVNSLAGGGGDDTLFGADGADELTGGSGADRFRYETAGSGVDTVTDFTRGAGGDALHLAQVLVGYPGSSAINDFVRLTEIGSDTMVAVDSNGGADSFTNLALLQNNVGLLLSDMIANGNLIIT